MSWTLALPLRRARLARAREAVREPAQLEQAVGAPEPPTTPPVTPQAPGAGAQRPQPRLRDWIGVLAMVFGLFMAIMDVQIVTSSLTQIQGGLSASTDEISWV